MRLIFCSEKIWGIFDEKLPLVFSMMRSAWWYAMSSHVARFLKKVAHACSRDFTTQDAPV